MKRISLQKSNKASKFTSINFQRGHESRKCEYLTVCNDLYPLTGKYIRMPFGANLLSTWQRFIISIINKHLTPDWSITRVGIQARQIHQHENSKNALHKMHSVTAEIPVGHILAKYEFYRDFFVKYYMSSFYCYFLVNILLMVTKSQS